MESITDDKKTKEEKLKKSTGAERAEEEKQHVTFIIGEETYGVEVLKVQEIIGMTQITHVPNTMSFMKGVINLRGSVVPVVDMRIKFKLGNVTYNQTTVVIILNVANRVVGMVVDGVSDVITLKAEEIKPPPEFGSGLDVQYLQGLGTADDRMIILVDIEKLMTSRDMELIETAEEMAA